MYVITYNQKSRHLYSNLFVQTYFQNVEHICSGMAQPTRPQYFARSSPEGLHIVYKMYLYVGLSH